MDPLDDGFDPDRYRMPASEANRIEAELSKQRQKPPKAKGRFFKGMPWELFTSAVRLPGKAFHVYSAVWHIANLEGKRTVDARPSVLRECGLERQAIYRAIAELEAAGLLEVERRPGAAPTVTLVDAETIDAGTNKRPSKPKGAALPIRPSRKRRVR